MVDVVDLFNACLFIQDNLDSDLSLMFLAQMAGLSRFRFHRVFKAWCGETLHDYVTRMRMERAAFELSYPVPRSNRRSVKAIAFASGYKSLSSFSHAFSAYAQVSPRQFRYRMLHDRALVTRNGVQAPPVLTTSRRARPPVHLENVFAPFNFVVRDEVERKLVVIESSVPGYRPLPLKEAALSALSGAGLSLYGVESLAELHARVLTRSQGRQRHSHIAESGADDETSLRAPSMVSTCVERSHWESLLGQGLVERRALRRATVTLKAGRYAVIEGEGSLRQLYRAWRTDFERWLVAAGECPRPDRAFIRLDAVSAPASMFRRARMTLFLPLEPQVERASRARPVLEH